MKHTHGITTLNNIDRTLCMLRLISGEYKTKNKINIFVRDGKNIFSEEIWDGVLCEIMPVVFLSQRNTHLRFLYLLLKYFTLKTTQRETNLRYTLNLDKLAWIEVSSIKTGSCQSKKSITNYNHNDCNWWVKKPSFKVTALSSRYMQLLPVQQN